MYGAYQHTTNNGFHEIWLAPDQLPTAWQIHAEWNVGLEEAARIRQSAEMHLLSSFFAQEMPPGPPIPLTEAARRDFGAEFARAGQISRENTSIAIDRYEQGALQDHPCRSTQMAHGEEPRPSQLWSPRLDRLPPGTPGDLTSAFQVFRDIDATPVQDDEMIADTDGNNSYVEGEERENKPPEDQNLMNLLYRIAEDQAKKDGFVHRGVNCNSCGMMPIRGIRYRCANCHNYDLCEQCEALQVHDKTHLFYKIRIPAPFLGNPQPTPVWYPGKPGKAARNLTTELKLMLSQKTGIHDKRLDAYWDQFQCLAANEYPNDPHGFRIAINRRGFNQCFVPNSAIREPPPNLVYDRMFSFYDSNDDGLIGFDEFLSGIACIKTVGNWGDCHDSTFQQKVFRAYDIDNDGFVDRKDFLRMFRAYYALTKELTNQVVSGMDDEFFDEEEAREVIAGSQPLSSIFSGAIPPGQQSLYRTGKRENRNGDLVIDDGQGILREEDIGLDHAYGKAPVNQNGVVADNAEIWQMGDVNSELYNSIRARGTLLVGDDEWPQRWLTPGDVSEALARHEPLEDIEDHIERSLVMCAGQERISQDGWNRKVIRRRAVTDRWEARQFYLDGSEMTRPETGMLHEETDSDNFPHGAQDLCSLRIAILNRLSGMDLSEHFRERTKREVQELWPEYPNMSEVALVLETLVRKKRKWHDIAKALAPTRAEIPKATVIVGKFLSYLSLYESLVNTRPESPTPDTSSSSPISKRPRSSSKVRFEDQINREDHHDGRSATSASSRNIPAGERWGGYNISEPEMDFGREVVYQITQEGMNELLDPIFKLREDLGLQVQRTKFERSLYKDEINECMRDGFAVKIMTFFEVYQKRWYQSARDSDMHVPSHTIAFTQFMLQALKLLNESSSHGHLDEGKRTDGKNLKEVTDAITQLDRATTEEVSGESSSTTEAREASPDHTLDERPESLVPEHPGIEIDLHDGVTAFNEADVPVEQLTKQKPLEPLLADAGYGIVTPSIQDFTWTSVSRTSSVETTIGQGVEQDPPDLTLPQNRPNNMSQWEARYATRQNPDNKEVAASEEHPTNSRPAIPVPKDKPELPDEDILKLALWSVIEEDDRKRGGAGRLSSMTSV